MRSLVVATALLVLAATADAKPKPAKKPVATKSAKSAKAGKTEKPDKAKRTKKTDKRAAKKRLAISSRRHPRIVIRGPIEGQSVGACWQGRLREANKLSEHDGWYIRRPHRAYGTRATVELVERVLADIVDRFPDLHAIAIGDISAERGGQISLHSSHQSGRDIDIGLIFTEKPAGYPASFVAGTADNLDLEATFVLVEEFAKTAREAGGVQMIFLDFDVQGLLYHWALENGETEEYLARLFQFPHGRGSGAGLVKHEPHHADHIHVRFRCPGGDTACR